MTTISKTELSVDGFDIPLKVKSSNKKNSIRFNNINPETGNRLKRVYIDPETDERVDNYHKGYELDGEVHEIGSRDEVKEFKKSLWGEGMSLEKVMDKEKFNRMIQQGHYFLAPDTSDDAPENSEKKYKLLVEVLKGSDSVLIVEFAVRSRPRAYGVYYNPDTEVLEMKKFAYPDTVKKPEFEITESVSSDLVEKIESLVEKVKEERSDSELVDNYREQLEGMIEDVVLEGEELDVETEKEETQEMELEEELESVM